MAPASPSAPSAVADYASAITQPTLGGPVPTYDELVQPDGALRPAWLPLAHLAQQISSEGLARVDAEIRTFLADEGVTYTRPGHDPEPWRLDALPLVLGSAEWARLEVGLAQRAELLNALLVDLYADQRTLSSGAIPPEVVFGHSGFLRALARVSRGGSGGASGKPGGEDHPLLLSATDIGRTESGEWLALADSAQAPSGVGYALENRRVISRVLPELYREVDLHRLEPFLQAWRATLMAAAPDDPADPRVVVLSPGPESETGYDQAAIASALGFPLVEGEDLTVRDGAVWMRVLGRLERVHVILRRVDADWSDPLELRGGSQLGVAGLTEAVRRGSVRVVNGLGSGVLENPALLPSLPRVCELLLGEELLLPSVETWWCGDPHGLDRVLDQWDLMSIRRIDGPLLQDWAGPGLDDQDLRAEVLRHPHRYVGQPRIALSRAPVFDAGPGTGAGALAPRPLTLRTFTIRFGSSYRPMVGGLASVREVERSKDVWVLKAAPDDPDQGIASVLPFAGPSAASVLVPRVLEDMFWFGRYAERAEDLLRLVLATHALAEDFRTRRNSAGGEALTVLLGLVHELAAGDSEAGIDADFRSLLLDHRRPGSVAQSLTGMRGAARGIRDQLSLDTWRAFASIDRAAGVVSRSRFSPQIGESAGRMLSGLLAVYGVTASMMRDPGWNMIGAGRHLERGLQLTRLLRDTVGTRRGFDVDRRVLAAVLDSAESSVTHRRRFRDSLKAAGVLDLLLLDAENPRSLLFALRAVRDHLAAMPESTGSSRPERLVAQVLETVESASIAELVAIGGVDRPHLHRFLAEVEHQLETAADAIATVHFVSGPAPRPFQTWGAAE